METPPVRLPVDLSQVEETPVSWANYFLLQHTSDDEFVLALAQLGPPVVLGDEGEQRKRLIEQLERRGVLVRVVARVVVSRQKLKALAELIDGQLERFPAGIEEAESEGPSA